MRKIFFLSAILFVSVVVSAQADFSGNWKLNSSKSMLGDQFSMAPNEIIIAQENNDLNVEKHASFQGNDFTINDKITLDGKECINQGMMDTRKKSIAVWSDDKKSLKITTKLPTQDGSEMTIIENYQFEGDNLVINASASSAYGEMEEKMVYDKL